MAGSWQRRVIQVDHLRNGFDGGRWIFVNAESTADYYKNEAAPDFIANWRNGPARREEFAVRPVMPLYFPGEPVEVSRDMELDDTKYWSQPAKIATVFGSSRTRRSKAPLSPATSSIVKIAPPTGKGLHIITARLEIDGRLHTTYHSAFWVRDHAYLRSGPELRVNENYFELDGKPLAVIGTTYMSSEVQRLYFDTPMSTCGTRNSARFMMLD